MADRTPARPPEHQSGARDLGGGLTLRSVAGPADVERAAAFDALIHGPGSEATWRSLMVEHPHADQAGWLLVEERATGRVVASLGLIPWRLSYAGVELRAAEMGVVGTLEEHRGRGLQRALNARFDALLLGHRSLDEMRHMYPDATVTGPARPLVEALFPKLRAWLYQPY